MIMKNQMKHRGLPKLIEEMGELGQVIGKMLNLADDQDIYWDGTSMKHRFTEEVADTLAAIEFACHKLDIDQAELRTRQIEKFKLYQEWDSETELQKTGGIN